MDQKATWAIPLSPSTRGSFIDVRYRGTVTFRTCECRLISIIDRFITSVGIVPKIKLLESQPIVDVLAVVISQKLQNKRQTAI